MQYVRYFLGILGLLGGFLVVKGIQEWYRRSQPLEKIIYSLDILTQKRIAEGYRGKHALVVSCVEGSQIIVLGNILGNALSFEKICSDLVAKKLISKEGIVSKNTYIIINGPFFGPTQMNGGVLDMLVRTIKLNSENVWYLRGPQDSQDSIARLSFFGKDLSFHHLKTIVAFLATLPSALYLLGATLSEPPLRIAPYTSDTTRFDRMACHPVEKGPIKAICNLNPLCYYPEGTLSGTLDSDEQSIEWATMNGLQYSGNGWHLISSPSQTLVQRYGYDRSAYAIIVMGKDLASSTITYYANAQGEHEFKGSESFFLVGKSS